MRKGVFRAALALDMRVLSADAAQQVSVTVDRFDASDETGGPCAIQVTVVNGSDLELDSGGSTPLHISYHWLDAHSREIRVLDGMRTLLMPPMPARSRRSYQIQAVTPAQPGTYLFQAALVQEHVMWLDGLDRAGPLPMVTIGHKRPWWGPGDTSVLYSAHEVLNRRRNEKYLSHQGRFRPIALFCETVNLCNNACIICAYDRQTRAKGTMSLELFEKVLKDYSEIGGGHLSLTPVVGDGLLDRHLVERLRRCESYPLIRGLSMTTNAAIADLFDDEELEYILRRLQRVYISVYGLNASEYRTMTRRDTYPRMLQGISRILRFATNELTLGFRLLVRRSGDEVMKWVEDLEGYRDSKAALSIQPPVYSYSNWGIFDTGAPLPADAIWRELPGQKDQCLIPLIGCQVFWDGKVSFCSCDDFDKAESLALGDLTQASLAELYNSKESRRLWNWRANGVPEFCKKCSFYRPLADIETAGDIFTDPLIIAGA